MTLEPTIVLVDPVIIRRPSAEDTTALICVDNSWSPPAVRAYANKELQIAFWRVATHMNCDKFSGRTHYVLVPEGTP